MGELPFCLPFFQNYHDAIHTTPFSNTLSDSFYIINDVIKEYDFSIIKGLVSRCVGRKALENDLDEALYCCPIKSESLLHGCGEAQNNCLSTTIVFLSMVDLL